ncbi:MAG: DUF1573 domain-containing protein [Planctomycetia bacterium]|nr:DUF1573 domain-containing protein [Planctomycetia bacterium]
MRLPNAWAVAVIAACLGAAIGAGTASLEAALRPWRAGDFAATPRRATGAAPAVEVPETLFNFGTVGVGGKGDHEFVIRNAGDAPLEITRGATSCSCTVSDFEEADGGSAQARIIPPGGSTKLRVQWRGKGDGGPFRQQASVSTNDPRRPQVAFVVEGVVIPTYRVSPPIVTWPKLSAGEGAEARVRVVTFGREPPVVESIIARDDKTSQFYSLASTPLGEADLATDTGATGGFDVTVAVRSGLPLGPLRQTIQVVWRMPEEVSLDIPVEGSVTGDLALAGAAWDASYGFLSLDTVSSRKGLNTTLFLTVKGPHRQEVRPVIRERLPASLEVVVGEGRPVGSGNVIRIPLTITIPPGVAPANHMGTPQAPAGRIVLDTGHPDSPTLVIPVRVAIIEDE